MSMFQYVLAGQSETVQHWYERELRRLVEWAWQQDWYGLPVTTAVEVVESAISACRPLGWGEYRDVCGSAALLGYVAREADEGFERLREFFQGVPGLFQVEWSCVQESVQADGDGSGGVLAGGWG